MLQQCFVPATHAGNRNTYVNIASRPFSVHPLTDKIKCSTTVVLLLRTWQEKIPLLQCRVSSEYTRVSLNIECSTSAKGQRTACAVGGNTPGKLKYDICFAPTCSEFDSKRKWIGNCSDCLRARMYWYTTVILQHPCTETIMGIAVYVATTPRGFKSP